MDTPAQAKNASSARSGEHRGSAREWLALIGGGMLILLAAALFAVGRAYRAGYLSQLGLDLSQVPEDFYGHLYWGYFGLVPRLLSWFVSLIIAFLILASLAWIIARLTEKISWIRGASDSWANFPGSGNPKAYEAFAASAYLVFVLGFFIFLTYAAMAETHEAGIAEGRKQIERLRANRGDDPARRWIEIHFSPERIEKGYRLLCTPDLCSIFDPAPEQRSIRMIPLEGLREIRVFDSAPQMVPSSGE